MERNRGHRSHPKQANMDKSIWVAIRPEFVKPRPQWSEKPQEKKAKEVGEEDAAKEEVYDDANKLKTDVVEGSETKETGEEVATASDSKEKQELSKKRKHEEQTKEKLTLKKRHGTTHPNKDERLCGYANRGETCPHKDCRYSHDVEAYLASKPSDLGPMCIVFEKFGHCPNAFMCRYGKAHIDYATRTNLTRSAEEGGVIEKQQINVLKKPLQLALRKKTYISSIKEKSLDAYPDKEVKLVDFSNKVYVAPLTTVGNLPFRRVMKDFGADITCSEMTMATNILGAQGSEWALVRRHESEDTYGIQVAGNYPNIMKDLSKVIEQETSSDFVDLNCGCPIDVVCAKGSGSALLSKPSRLCDIVKTMSQHLPSRSITVKVRIGHDEKHPTTHKLVPLLQDTAPGRIAAIMIHGRSKLQRYSKLANWDYILQCAQSQDLNKPLIPIIGNGDIFSFQDWRNHMHMLSDYHKEYTNNLSTSGLNNEVVDKELIGLCNCAMIGRGVLVKPWLPLEIKEQKLFDISANERFDVLKNFCNYGLEHWGSDDQGINTTRRFLLEWLSFLHRYVPVGLLEHKDKLSSPNARSTMNSSYIGMPNNIAGKYNYAAYDVDDVYVQTMNLRPPYYFGRSDLETLLCSDQATDWIKISEMLLGPVREDFVFIAKHKSNSYAAEKNAAAASTSTGLGSGMGMKVEEEGVDHADYIANG